MFRTVLGRFLQKKQSVLPKRSPTETASKKEWGEYGEEYVQATLEKKGFTLLARNYRKPCGEIDLVAQKGNLVVFVEVKLRTKHYFHTSEVIVPSKIKKIIRTARVFIATHRLSNSVFRFDVAIMERVGDDFRLKYIEDAFREDVYGNC